jgi:hypothetical protein
MSAQTRTCNPWNLWNLSDERPTRGEEDVPEGVLDFTRRLQDGLPSEVRSSTRPDLRRDLAAARHEHLARLGRLGFEGKLG